MKVYIQGFKSIKDPQRVAIGNKLTYLVGPNSAGKSVLLHALNKLQGASPEFEPLHVTLRNKRTSAHTSSSHYKSITRAYDAIALGDEFKIDIGQIHRNPNQNSTISAAYAFGVEWKQGSAEVGYYAAFVAKTILKNLPIKDHFNLAKLGGRVDEGAYEGGYVELISVHLNGTDVLVLENANGIYESQLREISGEKEKNKQDAIIINLASIDTADRQRLRDCMQWVLDTLNPPETSDLLSSRASVTPQDDKAIYEYGQHLTALLNTDILHWEFFTIEELIRKSYSGKTRQQTFNRLEHCHSIIARYTAKVIGLARQNYPGHNFETATIHAQRTLPDNDDLNAIVAPNIISNNLIVVPDNISNIYHELMASAASDEWDENTDDKDTHPSLISLVNKALSEALFIDNGYQVSVKAQALISKSLWDSALDCDPELEEWIWPSENLPLKFHCAMNLRDVHGRTLGFEDVGSGIGYVLPVLIESFNPKNRGKVVFLQQPELHLHPALQANLTDVLIEASADRRIVAETHSEHLILRALKRVRQTTNGTLKDPNLALKPQDVAVNYFEPLPDGSTKVHILRVSEDGDFLDRWPRGFFADRDRELFDE